MSTEPGRRRRLIAATAAVLVAIPAALALNAAASVPSTPSGWALQWSDDFTGSAGTLPSSQNQQPSRSRRSCRRP